MVKGEVRPAECRTVLKRGGAAHVLHHVGKPALDLRTRRAARQYPTQRNALHRKPQLQHLEHLVRGKFGHVGAAIGFRAHHSLGLQQPQSLANRNPADP